MKNNKAFKTIFTLPILVYSFILIVLPLLYVLFLSFCTSDSYGGFLYQFTLSNYIKIFDITYLKILFKSAMIGVITTIICILISYPFALILRRKSAHIQNLITSHTELIKTTTKKVKRQEEMKQVLQHSI